MTPALSPGGPAKIPFDMSYGKFRLTDMFDKTSCVPPSGLLVLLEYAKLLWRGCSLSICAGIISCLIASCALSLLRL